MRYDVVYEARKPRGGACPCGGTGGSAAPAGPETVKPEGCRPYLKLERIQPRFAACQRIAERLGPIDTPGKASEILLEAAGAEVAERFGVVTLDTHLHLRGIGETGAGETDAVMAPVLPTLHLAIADEAAAAIIYHVHPAASAQPSEADVEVTRRFARAFAEVGILLMDHIIVASGSRKGFYSFLESMPDALAG